MSDKLKVIIGLLIFFLIFTTPFWFKSGKKEDHKPILSKEAKIAGKCVFSKEKMKRDHMQLLDVWRDTVVRDGKRVFKNIEGVEFEMSISNSCLKCHTNKKEFCDKCHDYASVRPYCWDCHIEDPKGEDANEE